MKAFTKVVNPCKVNVYGERYANLFIKIKFSEDGRLSITGVEGPLRNGDAVGSCGQCGIYSDNKLSEDWTQNDIDRLRHIWDKWHLNDMKAYSPEMEALGWHKLTGKELYKHEYWLNDEADKKRKDAEKQAIDALTTGETFTPTEDQMFFAALPRWISVWTDSEDPQIPAHYKRAPDTLGNNKYLPPEKKNAGWVSYSDHKDGLLGRKVNPEDSHGYGGKWWKKEVPTDVIDFLKNLPDTKVKPAWV